MIASTDPLLLPSAPHVPLRRPMAIAPAQITSRFGASDWLMLVGVALMPFVAPKPGQFNPTVSDWSERVTICDGFFVLALALESWKLFFGELRNAFALTPLSRQVGRAAAGWQLMNDRRSSWVVLSIWFGAMGLLIAMGLSWIANPFKAITLHMALALLIEIYLLMVGLLVARKVIQWGTFKPLIIAWICGFSVLTVICLYDSAALITGHTMIYPGVEQRLRGPFRTSAQLASYTLTSLFVVLAGVRMLREHRLMQRIGISLAIVAPLFIILASRRSALASLLAGFITLLILSQNRIRIIFSTVVPVLAAIAALVLFAPPALQDYFMRRVEPLIGEDPQRVQVAVDHFQRGVAAFKEHPVLGVGFGAFSDTRFGNFDESITHEQHSGYIAILAETGAVGFTLLILLHLFVLIALIHVYRTARPRYREFAATLIVLLVAMGVSEVYNRIWRERDLWVVLGVVAALVTLAARDRFLAGGGFASVGSLQNLGRRWRQPEMV